MIYGFINDTVFYPPVNKSFTDVDGVDPLVGHLNIERREYFVRQLIIDDSRKSRLDTLGNVIDGKLSFTFDKEKEQQEVTILINSSKEVIASIFNIIEKCVYRVNVASSTTMDAELLGDTTTFAGYIPGSLSVSSKFTNVELFGNINDEFPIIDFIRFSVLIDGVPIEFKLWMNGSAFAKDYPLSTICEIVPPISYTTMLNPTGISIFEAVLDSATTNQEKLSKKIENDGYTGYVSYATMYVDPIEHVVVKKMPFNILYKGAKPGSLEIRHAIRDHILSLNIADEATWKKILPNLFVTGQFFILPMWDNISVRPKRIMFRSIMDFKTIQENVDKVLFDLDEDMRKNKVELIMASYLETPLIAVPDHLNENKTTIKDAHPTYQYYGTQNVEYGYQEKITKEFTNYLNRALSVAAGESTNDLFNVNNFGDRTFISFVVNELEFHVITKVSYLKKLKG